MKAFREDIHVKIDALPPQKRGEVKDFVEFLLSREQDTENLGGDKRRRTLKGIWKGSEVDAGLFADARRDLFPYEKDQS